VVVLVSHTEDFTVGADPVEVLLAEMTISDPGGAGFPDNRRYDLPNVTVPGVTNMRAVINVLTGTASNVRITVVWNASSDPDNPTAGGGTQWFNNQIVGTALSPGTVFSVDDPQIGDFGNAREVLVNKFGQDPVVYGTDYGGVAGPGNHLIVRDYSTAANSILVQLYGTPRGKTLTVPIPPGTVPGDRVVVIFMSQQAAGGDDTLLLPRLPLTHFRGDGDNAPAISKVWFSDYTHNHQFTGPYPENEDSAFAFRAGVDDISGEFISRPGETVTYLDPVTGVLTSDRAPGDQQTGFTGFFFSQWQGQGATDGSSGSTIILGSTEYRLPQNPPGTLPGTPLPPALDHYTFHIDGGRVRLDISHFSACTLVLRNEFGAELYGGPYRRTPTLFGLDSQFGYDLSISHDGITHEITYPEPPPLAIAPADPTDLIVTAYTYEGRSSWGNPNAEASDTVVADTSNIRMFSMGTWGYEPDGEPPGTTPGWVPIPDRGPTIWPGLSANLDPSYHLPDGWEKPGFDDSAWMVPVQRHSVVNGGIDYISTPYESPERWTHYAFPRAEIVLWRMEFTIPSDGYAFKDGIVKTIMAHKSGPVMWDGWGLTDNSTWDMPWSRWYDATSYHNANLLPITNFTRVYDGRVINQYYYNGHSLRYGVPPLTFDEPHCLAGWFYCWSGPWDINPAGINASITVNKSLFDGNRIEGLRDTSASMSDPPLVNLIRARETTVEPTLNRQWVLGRELYVQQAGQRAGGVGTYDYEFESVPAYLPVPPSGKVYSVGTGFRFVWRDAGPVLGTRTGPRHSTVQFMG
jgi:hypothetical protein